ncbi:MAG: hypothetical protein LBB68_08335 [Treponema sp.]|nr:hypothetical protein [Treponema sp.]
MERFLSSFFPILILIAVVALRIVSMVKRRKRKQEQKTDRGFNPWANNPPAPPNPAAVLHTEQALNQEEEFSAWNLSVDEYIPPKPVPVPTMPEPRSGEIRLAVFPAKLPVETPAPVITVPEDYVPETAKAGDSGISGEVCSDTPNPVVSRIRSLPALQQGIIWAEILGTPKGNAKIELFGNLKLPNKSKDTDPAAWSND